MSRLSYDKWDLTKIVHAHLWCFGNMCTYIHFFSILTFWREQFFARIFFEKYKIISGISKLNLIWVKLWFVNKNWTFIKRRTHQNSSKIPNFISVVIGDISKPHQTSFVKKIHWDEFGKSIKIIQKAKNIGKNYDFWK